MRKPLAGIVALIAAIAMMLSVCTSNTPSADSSAANTDKATVAVKGAKGNDVEAP
ncbi:hypothetical protein [Propionimicrobium lymphophilum]|uniref:hypothetical protein n=1 Tax=Propionimicrobium lymphophilum TaxID=33012 RepID=UPI00041A20EA|nr:hypothetical protein [Propionimicrobium lymphophilum]